MVDWILLTFRPRIACSSVRSNCRLSTNWLSGFLLISDGMVGSLYSTIRNSTGPPLASNRIPCPFQAQFHHVQLPGWSSTGVPDRALPFRDIPARRNLRSSSQVQLLVPRFRKERSGRRGFSVSSPQLWNLLPVDIRLHHDEYQLFRRRLKTHYMQQSLLPH